MVYPRPRRSRRMRDHQPPDAEPLPDSRLVRWTRALKLLLTVLLLAISLWRTLDGAPPVFLEPPVATAALGGLARPNQFLQRLPRVLRRHAVVGGIVDDVRLGGAVEFVEGVRDDFLPTA